MNAQRVHTHLQSSNLLMQSLHLYSSMQHSAFMHDAADMLHPSGQKFCYMSDLSQPCLSAMPGISANRAAGVSIPGASGRSPCPGGQLSELSCQVESCLLLLLCSFFITLLLP